MDEDYETVALRAIGWILCDEARAARMLALTGLTPDILRDGLGTSAVQGAMLDFLERHEPDLVACAAALDLTPERLVAARRSLSQ